MLLFFFLYLIEYSQRNINMPQRNVKFLIKIFFLFSLIFLLIFALCISVSLLLGVRWFYDVYFLCELYLLSLKIFIFASFKN